MLRTACLAWLPCGFVFAQQAANEVHGPNFDVVADRVIRMQANGKPIYSVSYRYDFKNLPSVVIDGVGAMPPSGQLNYLLTGNHLTFRTADSNGTVLADVPLQETVQLASVAPDAELPRQGDFPPQFVTRLTSTPPPAFRSSVYSVLGKYFECMPVDDGTHSLVWTTYVPLQLKQGPKNVIGKVAVLISFPFDPVANGFEFRIQSLTREGRPQSDEWREPETPAVTDAARAFVDQLARELAGSAAQR